MRRVLSIVLGIAVVIGILGAVILSLETQPTVRDEPSAIKLRAPDGYAVTTAGAVSFSEAVDRLKSASGDRVGIEFSDDGDTVILLADRVGQQITEMRAARTGTIVERTWQGGVDRRLDWAVENGNLEVPGMPAAVGKNLYH